MVAKTYYAARDMRHPIYRTRMLKAGDELEISGPLGPAFVKMGHITEEKPRRAAPKVEAEAPAPVDEQPAKPKRKAPRRKKTA
jgi:hypothetical protein